MPLLKTRTISKQEIDEIEEVKTRTTQVTVPVVTPIVTPRIITPGFPKLSRGGEFKFPDWDILPAKKLKKKKGKKIPKGFVSDTYAEGFVSKWLKLPPVKRLDLSPAGRALKIRRRLK